MMEIYVKVNDKVIAVATALNVSNLSKMSDYEGTFYTRANPVTGEYRKMGQYKIYSHDREQSPWALVEKIARKIMENDNG